MLFFFKNEIISYVIILLFINSILMVIFSLVKKNVIKGYYFYCYNLIFMLVKYMLVKG